MNDIPLHIAKREQPGKWASLALTIGVHVVLIAFLVFGIRWQSSPPAAMQVDLVAEPAPAAAPAEPPPPEPKPEPKPEPPKPQPKPEPPKPEPPKPQPKPEPKPEPKPDIANKAQKPEPKKPEPPKPEPKPEPKKPEPPKPEPKKPEPPKPEPKPKTVEPPRDDYMAQRLAQESAQTAARSQMERMMRDDAARAASAASASSKSAREGYSNAIRTKVRGNLLRPPGLTGNPEAVFEVDQLPTGEVLAIRLKRSSGVPALDDAIERAIRRSSPLPLPKDGDLFERTLELKFRPLED